MAPQLDIETSEYILWADTPWTLKVYRVFKFQALITLQAEVTGNEDLPTAVHRWDHPQPVSRLTTTFRSHIMNCQPIAGLIFTYPQKWRIIWMMSGQHIESPTVIGFLD